MRFSGKRPGSPGLFFVRDRSPRIARTLAAAVLLTTTSAGSLGQSVPAAPSPDRADTAALAARAVTTADARVAAIGYGINAANLDRCPVPGLAPGLVLDAADQFPRAGRDAARRAFGLGDRVTVAAIVPGSPADRAGLVPGDELVAIGGSAIPPVPLDRPDGSYASVRAALDSLAVAAAGRTAVALDVRRAGRPIAVTLSAPPGCAIRVQLVPSRDINGFADDRYATITTALERFATDDDELALFLGHELAHAYLRHAARLDGAAPLHRLFGRALLSSRTVLETEREADRLGMILAARAGYDVSGAPTFWRRLGEVTRDGAFTRTHPGTRERIAAATQEAEEIRRRRAAGQPL